MFELILVVIKAIFILLFGKKRDFIIENLVLRKELEILKRKNRKRVKFEFTDKLFFAILNNISNKVKKYIIIVKPETLLKWQRYLIKKFWTFPSNKLKVGRPSVDKRIKSLILDIKNKNLY